jgi:cellulose synthase/poly-beta-1,6-N-acetylglucosamine synthase-like glycosyltransferase
MTAEPFFSTPDPAATALPSSRTTDPSACALLSILIPVYNEEEFIQELLSRVVAAPLPDGLLRELIIVDDGSTDDSVAAIEAFIAAHPEVSARLIRQSKNRGKGAATTASFMTPTSNMIPANTRSCSAHY